MPFKRFVETGRVAYISGGRYCGKLCSIVDVIDQTRVLVDGPKTGVPRIPVRLNQIRLTKYLVKFPFKASTRVIRKAWESSKILDNWKGGQWSSNLSKRKLRRHLSDFDRFKLRHARKMRNSLRTAEYCKLLKADKKRKAKLIKAKEKQKSLQKPTKDGQAGAGSAVKPKTKKAKTVKKTKRYTYWNPKPADKSKTTKGKSTKVKTAAKPDDKMKVKKATKTEKPVAQKTVAKPKK